MGLRVLTRDIVGRFLYPYVMAPLGLRSPFLRKHVSFQHRAQFASPDIMRTYQLDRLRKVIWNARRNVPWYQQVYGGLNLPDDFPRCIEDMHRLPLLRRKDIQANPGAFVSRDADKRFLRLTFTGGSSGQPTPFYLSRREAYREWVTRSLVNSLIGHKEGYRLAGLWGSRKDTEKRSARLSTRIGQWASNLNIYDCYVMNDEIMDAYHKALSRWNPHLLVCYAGAAVDFARYLRSHNIKPTYPRIGLVCTAEMLNEVQREEIEVAFDRPVQNRYGCRELGAIAAECSYQSGLHTLPAAHVVEVVHQETGQAMPQGEGELVVTSLLNMDVPWIRYRTGDVACLEPAHLCDCGRQTVKIRDLKGRVMDTLTTTVGDIVHGSALNPALWALPGLTAYQVTQQSPDRLTIHMQTKEELPAADLETAAGEIRKIIGRGCHVAFERVHDIPKTPSGKRRFIINQCAGAQDRNVFAHARSA